VNHDPEVIRKLESLPVKGWEGTVYRHVLGKLKPDRENTRGARWNPPETSAIYCSVARETALAEGEHNIALQPVRPTAARQLYKVNVRLARVIDLSSWESLTLFGINEENFAEEEFELTQTVGGAVERLHCDGMLVPSARHGGTNLVIFPRQALIPDFFDPIGVEVINEST
jgi:RES domain-containing protein